jgi:hypothetical protein
MLRIRIDGQDVETTPALLAKLVFDGKVDQHSVTKLPGGTTEQPLEQALGAPHAEALTAELHRRLGLMCSMDATAVDAQELCARVEGLCRWRWASLPAAARFFWAAGWLNELADRAKNAIEFYDAFLLLPSGESHLRLLALNNRGVLRLQLGRLEGVQDLARAAISDFGSEIRGQGPEVSEPSSGPNPPSGIRHPPSGGLPAACFNLLNLINVSFRVADLLRTVEEELADYFARLPEDLRAWWLGPPSRPDGSDSHAEPSHPPGRTRQDLLILRDPTYRRLNTLVTHLAAQARGLVPARCPPLGHASSVFRQLSLWDCRLSGDRPGLEEAGRPADDSVPDQHQRYAEAASLLLSDDIPSLLTGPENPLARMEQSAREELAVTEGYVAAGQYELAKSRLHVQRKVLLSLHAPGALAAVLARVEARLAEIGALEEQLEVHQGQHHAHRALSALQSGSGAWDQVRDDLAEALRHDPSSWLTVSWLFGWGTQESGGKDPCGVNLPAAPDRASFSTEQAGLLLGRVLGQWGADTSRCLRLWQCVEKTLSPALAGPNAQALAQARLLAEKCLESWPAGASEAPGRADPRHPVNRFLEACEKARCLAEAEQLLEARPPRLEEAKRHLAGILRSGVDTRDQLRRMVAGFYLAQCRENDAPSVQRQVLADLEAWVEALPQEAVRQMRGREIVEESEKVRVAVA